VMNSSTSCLLWVVVVMPPSSAGPDRSTIPPRWDVS
jgi:hypothetical protein